LAFQLHDDLAFEHVDERIGVVPMGRSRSESLRGAGGDEAISCRGASMGVGLLRCAALAMTISARGAN
jgi:hypothetical protein